MKIPFKIEEFCIERWAIPQRVATSILQDHILELLPFRLEKGYPLTAVEDSGYRSRSYELRRGRSGSSQHTFPERDGKTGAVDWTCIDKKRNLELLDYILENTSYTRIAIRYNSDRSGIKSIHCDHKTVEGQRQLFFYNTKNEWEFIKHIN